MKLKIIGNVGKALTRPHKENITKYKVFILITSNQIMVSFADVQQQLAVSLSSFKMHAPFLIDKLTNS